ncbi:MAG TPA: transcriptional repressor [Acidobacteriota bacterium]
MPGRHHWQHRFRANVCRWTLPREAILDVLSRSSKHKSAKEIYASLYSLYPGIGLTTVYRTLELLSRLGFVQKVTAGDGQGRYELRSENKKDHHHHLICTSCGKIVDYRDFVQEELDLVKKTEEALAKKHNFQIQDHNIEFLGLCEKCRQAAHD